MLFKNEIVYDGTNFSQLIGDGETVDAGGERRLLSRLPPPLGATSDGFAKPFGDVLQVIPRSEWSARLKEQLELEARVSDWQNFPSYDQNGLPTCWANGPCAAASTMRVMMGLPYKQISACSVAVPISGGHQGGWEGDALDYLAKHGGVSVDLWPNNDTRRSLMNDAACQADRENFKALEWVDLGSKFENYVTAALLGFPMAVAYNDWSHVVMLCDAVEIEPGSFGLRIRNNWSESWGAKNKYGFGGYAVFREGARSHGRPSSGFALRQVTPAVFAA